MSKPLGRLLGQLAVDRGFLTAEQLALALRAQQRQTPTPPLGIVLVEQGLLRHEAVEELLALQAGEVGPEPRAVDETRKAWRLGALLLRRRLATPEQVNRALREQARRADAGEPWKPLGEILVEAGALAGDQLGDLLAPQREEQAASTPTLAEATCSGVTDATVSRAGRAPEEPGSVSLARRRSGRYEILEELGRGGMGVVYRAYDREMRREVALKMLPAAEAANPDTVERLVREARTAGSLEHPGIVPIYDVGIIDGAHYLAMAYIRGQTFAQALAAGRLPGLRERVGVIREAAAAVAHAHERGVVHRDLKPSNLMLDEAGRVHVMDFGLARRMDEEARLTATGQVLGTPQYMAPEQIEGDLAALGPSADVYALGAVLYEAIVGETPFTGKSVAELFAKILQREPEPPGRRNAKVAPDLETICLKALAKEPEQRYPTAGDLAGDLGRYLEGEAILGRRQGRWERAVRWSRRRKALATALAGLLLAVGTAAVLGWRASFAERERQRLAHQVLEGLRERAELCVTSVLLVRRAGGKIREAEEQYVGSLEQNVRTVTALAPDLPEPEFHLGRLYRALMRFDDALAAQDRALGRAPGYAPSRYERGVLRSMRYRQRVQELEQARQRARGLQMAQAGPLSGGGAAGAGASPADAEAWVAGDAVAQGWRSGVLEDLAVLERSGRAGDPQVTGWMSACARGLWLAHRGRPEDRAESRRLLEGAVRERPALEEAHAGLAVLALAEGDWEGAIAAYTRGLEADRGYEAHLVGRGLARAAWGCARLRQGEDAEALYAAAVADLGQALEFDPSCAENWAFLASVRGDWGNYKFARGEDPGQCYGAAIAEFDRAVELLPARAESWIGRGNARLNWGLGRMRHGEDPRAEFAAAIADFDRVLAEAPSSVDGWIGLGHTRVNRGGYLRSRGEDPRAEYAAAIAAYDRALSLDPTRAETWRSRGSAHVNRGNHQRDRGENPDEAYAAAIADYGRALESNPGAEGWSLLAGARLNWANVQRERGEDPSGQYAAALADLGKALEGNPADSDTWQRRGATWVNWGIHEQQRGDDPRERFAAAIADFGKALERNPGDPQIWNHRGNTHSRWGTWMDARGGDPGERFAAAIADFDQALKLNPGYADAWSNRGCARMRWGQHRNRRGEDPDELFAAGIADFGRALELDPADAQTWGLRGGARFECALRRVVRGSDAAELFAAAMTDFAKALEMNPADAEAWARRGMSRRNWGSVQAARGEDPGDHWAAAIADFDRALERNPARADFWKSRGDVSAYRAEFLRRRGQDPGDPYAAAIADFGKALERNPRYLEAWVGRGSAQLDWGMHAEARGEDPGDRYAAAISDYGRALELDPARATCWIRRGTARAKWALHRNLEGEGPRELLAAAVADHEKGLGLDPANASAHLDLASLYGLMRRWLDAEAELETALRLDPALEPRIRPQLAWIRSKRPVQPAAAEASAWLVPLERAAAALQAGDRPTAAAGYEEVLRALESHATTLDPGARETFLADPAIRRLLVTAHYNLACLDSVSSAGPGVPAEEAVAGRGRAFAHLDRAVALGWQDRKHLEQDPDLTPLHDDPRWSALLARFE